MADAQHVVEQRPPRRWFGLGAGFTATAAIGSTVWAYLEYAGKARSGLLCLALAGVFLAIAATVLLSFRVAFPFRTMSGPRPPPPHAEKPLRLLEEPHRRGWLGLVAASCAGLVALLLLPLRSLGSRPAQALRATAWRRGVRLLTPEGAALRPEDLPPGGATPIVPEGATDDANSAATLLRLRGSGELRAYSLVCTHAGCAVCVFRSDESLLVCPCHNSTFDAAAGGRVLTGPASQPLPELPLAVDAQGYLVADRDFDRPIGPRWG